MNQKKKKDWTETHSWASHKAETWDHQHEIEVDLLASNHHHIHIQNQECCFVNVCKYPFHIPSYRIEHLYKYKIKKHQQKCRRLISFKIYDKYDKGFISNIPKIGENMFLAAHQGCRIRTIALMKIACVWKEAMFQNGFLTTRFVMRWKKKNMPNYL